MSSINPRPCPVCSSIGDRELLYQQPLVDGPLGAGYRLCVCEMCGAGFADGIPPQKDLNQYYREKSKYTYAYSQGIESKYDRARFELIVGQLLPHVRSKRSAIVEIGCATGGMLALLNKLGYTNVRGFDPSPECAAIARDLHCIDVEPLGLGDLRSYANSADVVIAVGVLEHLNDLQPGIEVMKSLLRPGGCLFCAQPDVQAFSAHNLPPFQQFSAEHVNFFSEKSLSRAFGAQQLAAHGFCHWTFRNGEGTRDSAVSGVFRPAVASIGDQTYDDTTRLALQKYIFESKEVLQKLAHQVGSALSGVARYIVWGGGTQFRTLLGAGLLNTTSIKALIDSDPALHGTTVCGFPVLPPEELQKYGDPVFICSERYATEIQNIIQSRLQLRNRLIVLDGNLGR